MIRRYTLVRSWLRRPAVWLIALVVVTPLLSLSLTTTASAGSTRPDVAVDQMDRIDADRSSIGLPKLARSQCLSDVAAGWSQQMSINGTISHTGFSTRYDVCGQHGPMGENVGVITGGCKDPQTIPCSDEMMQLFLNSPDHRQNIESASGYSWTLMGVGAYLDDNGGLWVTQAFLECGSGYTCSSQITAPYGGGTTVTSTSTGTTTVASPPTPSPTSTLATGIASTPTGRGYWVALANGQIRSYGDAPFKGDMTGKTLNKPVVGIASTPSGQGYWMVATDGGIFNFGDAGLYGTTASLVLSKPIVGLAATPSGHGYWLVGADGGVFSFGDAQFLGSTGGYTLNRPVVGVESGKNNLQSYRFVATDGGIFNFGNAGFFGSTGSIALNQPIVGMTDTPTNNGYWLVAADGGIFSFGDAKFFGALPPKVLPAPISGMIPTPSGAGYWLVGQDGTIYPFGDASLLPENH